MAPAKGYTNKDIEELFHTLRGTNGTPGVLERLTRVEIILQKLDKWVDGQMEAKAAKPDQADPPAVMWSWVRDKLVQPTVLLVVGSLISYLTLQLAK
jgi:hypothetical protein